MTTIRPVLVAVIAMTTATLLFWLTIHQISGLWLGVALRPELREALEQHRADQLALRKLDPKNSPEYRKRFEKAQRLLARIEILRLGQANMLRRFEAILVTAFALASFAAAFALLLRHRRAEAHERRTYADRIAALQETARQQAHEIKGPLTAARMELERYADLVRAGGAPEQLDAAHHSIADELDRVARTTKSLSTLAGLGTPVLRRQSLRELVDEFSQIFAGAWSGMTLRAEGRDALVCADRELIRQVLVNLCSNSAAAGATALTLTIEPGARPSLIVRDNGRGVAGSLGERIFDPYVTTRRTSESVGLGLAISRKILLDHGGDLRWVRSSEPGATFAILFGDPASCPEAVHR